MQHFPSVMLKIEQFRLDPVNAMTHSSAEIQRLRGVIEEHGFLTELCVDAESVIDDAIEIDGALYPSFQLVGGEARLEAARGLGYTELPAKLATFDSDAQRKAAGIALNGHYGSFDDEQLEATIRELMAADYDIDLTGLAPFEIETLLNGDDDTGGDDSSGTDDGGDDVWGVIIECDNEQHQLDLLDRFLKEGLQCRALL